MGTSCGSGALAVRPVDEPDLVVRGLAELMRQHRDKIRVVPATTPDRLVDLTLYDCFRAGDLPTGEARLAELSRRGAVAVWSWHLPRDLAGWAVAHGAAGCLVKDLPAVRLMVALRQIGAGHVVLEGLAPASPGDLTPREAEVVSLVGQGLSNREVAAQLGIGANSLKSYIRTAYRKIGATSRSQAVLWAVEHGYGPSGSTSVGRRPVPVPVVGASSTPVTDTEGVGNVEDVADLAVRRRLHASAHPA